MTDYSTIGENIDTMRSWFEKAGKLSSAASTVAGYLDRMHRELDEVVTEAEAVENTDISSAIQQVEAAFDTVSDLNNLFDGSSGFSSSVSDAESALDSLRANLEELSGKVGTLDELASSL